MNTVGTGIHSRISNRERSSQNIKRGLTSSESYSNPSFKGLEREAVKKVSSIISNSDKEIIDVFSKYYGNIGNRVGDKIGKLITEIPSLEKSSRFVLKDGINSIKDKKIGQSLWENIVFPFTKLPLYAVSWVVKQAQKIPVLKNKAENIYRTSLLRNSRKFNELDEKTDIIKGIYDKTKSLVTSYAKEKDIPYEELVRKLNSPEHANDPVVKEASDFVREKLYKVSNKFFDKHTGNFNTAYERPLNRIISGLIPAAFLANDAYNLSVLCGDDKEASKKEANERRKQEISRVFTTAYMQLLTFGAFTKQVNTIPWFTPLTSAATVLLSETTSRKRLGKPVLFLSKDGAKRYNKKKAEKEASKHQTMSKEVNKEDVQSFSKPQIKIDDLIIKQNQPKIFTSFKALDDKNNISKSKENKKVDDGASKKDEPKKALINFKTFKVGVTSLIAAGFALSFIKNSSLTKNTKIVQGISKLGNLAKDKIYNPIAYKDFSIDKNRFKEITENLTSVGCKEIAEGHEFIKNKYGKETADGLIKMYKAVLPSDKVSEVSKNVIKNIKTLGVSLSDKETKILEESIKTASKLEKTSISEYAFSDVAKQAVKIMKNKGVTLEKDAEKILNNSVVENMSKVITESPIKIDTKAKPFIDIVIQPFKFVFSAAKLPFKLTKSVLGVATSKVEKKAAKALIGEAELTKTEKAIHTAVKNVFGESASKDGKISQTIFANAMERLDKTTAPYRKVLAEYNEVMQNPQSTDEAKKAVKDSLAKAKEKLMIYVNTAVEKSFNGVTQSSNKNTDLAMMSKLASSAVTSAFLVADNYNMVMIKSDGEDKESAKETANERIIQRLSALFYQTLFINWFNDTFRTTYNSSLKGMTAVVIPNTLTTEVITRKSIGMPIGRKTYEELQANEENNTNRKGFVGKYFKFMRLLTGKKPLKDRIPKDKNIKVSDSAIKKDVSKLSVDNTKNTTNLLEKLSK